MPDGELHIVSFVNPRDPTGDGEGPLWCVVREENADAAVEYGRKVIAIEEDLEESELDDILRVTTGWEAEDAVDCLSEHPLYSGCWY